MCGMIVPVPPARGRGGGRSEKGLASESALHTVRSNLLAELVLDPWSHPQTLGHTTTEWLQPATLCLPPRIFYCEDTNLELWDLRHKLPHPLLCLIEGGVMTVHIKCGFENTFMSNSSPGICAQPLPRRAARAKDEGWASDFSRWMAPYSPILMMPTQGFVRQSRHSSRTSHLC